MEFFNSKCPQPRYSQNCGGCEKDTSCGMPPKTIMPFQPEPQTCNKTVKKMTDKKENCMMPEMPKIMPAKTMPSPIPSSMPGKSMTNPMPDMMPGRQMTNTMPSMAMPAMPDRRPMTNTMPSTAMPDMTAGRSMQDMMSDRTMAQPGCMAKTMPDMASGRNMANMMPNYTGNRVMPDRSMVKTMPDMASEKTMTNMMPDRAMANTMPDRTMANAMPGWNTGNMPGNTGAFKPDNDACWDHYPIGMAYVPWQKWQQPYPIEQGFNRGTIFPELDLPFMMGRCQ